MDRIAILTDSSCDIPASEAEARGITIIPLKVIFGQQQLRDGIDITPSEFYVRLQQSKELPTTSQPSAGEFVDVYRELSQSADSIISIHISEDLSGTLMSARAAKAQLDSSVPIHIVDSRSTSVGLGFVVLAAARMVADGLDAPRIVERLDSLTSRIKVLFAVDTLKYLHKGGRIGGAERLLGSILSIKPLLHIDKGKIDALEKARTKKRALARLLEIMETEVAGAQRVHFAVVHAVAEEEALQLVREIEMRFSCRVPYLCELCPALGVHNGPGLVGAAWWVEEG